MPIGQHVSICEVPSGRTYVITTGNRYLNALEDGEIRCWPDTHTFMINEATGDLTITGDHGTFAACWTQSMRGGRTLARFLSELSFDYFMRKASTRPHMVADIDATITEMKSELLRERRNGTIDKADAREMWDSIELYLDAGQGREEFINALYSDATLYDRYCDGGPHIVEREHDGLRSFWDDTWSVFRRDVLLAQDAEKVAEAA